MSLGLLTASVCRATLSLSVFRDGGESCVAASSRYSDSDSFSPFPLETGTKSRSRTTRK